MTFGKKRGEYYYGVVKGTSMWPELIPGDILRAEIVKTDKITPGDIVVVEYASENPVVHRLLAKEKQTDDSFVFLTAGDRSGEDPPKVIGIKEELLKVVGVLRKGAWKSLGRKPFPHSCRLPDLIVRLHCRVAVKFLW